MNSISKHLDKSGRIAYNIGWLIICILDGQPDPGERREYYVTSWETVFLYIKNSKRGGVYRYNEGAWQYDPSNSTVFAWDKPMGKLCGFPPGVTDPDICLDAFLSYSEGLLMPNHFKSYDDFQQNLAELKEQYARPSCALMFKCLQTANDSAYLEYLAYWSGGMEHPLYDQIANGTIRKVFCRMRELADWV